MGEIEKALIEMKTCEVLKEGHPFMFKKLDGVQLRKHLLLYEAFSCSLENNAYEELCYIFIALQISRYGETHFYLLYPHLSHHGFRKLSEIISLNKIV